MMRNRLACGVLALSLPGLLLLWSESAHAGWPFGRRARAPQPTAYTPNIPPPGVAPSPMLGTFYPTPYMYVRGNGTSGGGYSPLGIFGDNSLSEYGPVSSLRAVSAPVPVYTRGYEGGVHTATGTASSYPNLVAPTPVIYPTQATYVYGFQRSGTPPWWRHGINWLDQN